MLYHMCFEILFNIDDHESVLQYGPCFHSSAVTPYLILTLEVSAVTPCLILPICRHIYIVTEQEATFLVTALDSLGKYSCFSGT